MIACMLAGCATPGRYHAYEGPMRQPSELALVFCTAAKTNTFSSLGMKKSFVETATITQLDGQPLPPAAARNGACYVLPGKHVLHCRSAAGDSVSGGSMLSAVDHMLTLNNDEDLVLHATPGAQYSLCFLRTSRYGKESAIFWMTDADGTVVAGASPYGTNAAPAAGTAASPSSRTVRSGTSEDDLGASTPPFFLAQLPADKATVCVFRKKRFVSAAVSFGLKEENTSILSLGNGRFGHFFTTPGPHVFSSHLGLSMSATRFDFKAGRIYYLEADINGKMTDVGEPVALETIRKISPIK
jgi:hypothetical protein